MIAFTLNSGRRVDISNPDLNDICIEDIASGLSKICRFSGQVPRFHSVGMHSILVAMLVSPQMKLAALLHDASEAYLGDVSRNLKHSPFMAGYRQLESRWTRVIEDYFNLVPEMPAEAQHYRDRIKEADDMVAVWERVVLRHGQRWSPAFICGFVSEAVRSGYIQSHGPDFWRLGLNLPEVRIGPEDPRDTEVGFITTYQMFQADRA